MSQDIRYKGTLTKLKRFENEKLENQCKRVLMDAAPNFELDNYYDTYKEYLIEEFDEDHYIDSNDNLYKVDREYIEDDNGFFILNSTEEGKFTFDVKFYNGGCGFDEALDEAFKNYKKQ